ncbi:hypothetical protein, partial [Helicobacter pylori]
MAYKPSKKKLQTLKEEPNLFSILDNGDIATNNLVEETDKVNSANNNNTIKNTIETNTSIGNNIIQNNDNNNPNLSIADLELEQQ